jgi:hypothetical protein
VGREVKLETDEALKIHIEGLQATLTKRNARIAELEEKLAKPIDLPADIQKRIDKAYASGWKAAAAKFTQLATVARDLGRTVHMEGEALERRY